MSKRKKSKPTSSTGREVNLWHRAIIAEYARLRSFPGVTSVSIGRKEIGGKVAGGLCIKIYVERKLGPQEAKYHIPRTTTVLFPVGYGVYKARRVRTDVVEVPGIRLIASPASRLDPLPPGAQIGFPLGVGGAGTLGCWVTKSGGSEVLFLTAGHVVGNGEGPVPSNQAVYQPQPPFPSPEFDRLIIGQTIEGFIGNDMDSDGYLDYAAVSLSTPMRGTAGSSPEPCISIVDSHLQLSDILAEKTSIRKYGSQTKCTEGVFTAFHAHFTDTNGTNFNNILEFSSSSPGQAIADSGDSGSIVVSRSADTSGAAVGLLFGVAANDNTRAFVIPFERLARLGFQIANL